MIAADQLTTDLTQFTGTDQYYYNPLYPAMKYTDGVRYLVQQAEAYWLLDIIGTEYFLKQHTGEYPHFLVIKLIVTPQNTAEIFLEDGDLKAITARIIDYTDFPEGTWRLWLIDGVLILPSEY